MEAFQRFSPNLLNFQGPLSVEMEVKPPFANHVISINESSDSVGEIISSKITKFVVRATELNNENIYVLQIGARLCYKLGQVCFITN